MRFGEAIEADLYEALKQAVHQEIRCHIPGIIHQYNPRTQTAVVKPSVMERMGERFGELPMLMDVPVFFPGGAGMAMTYPVNPGDECLVCFSDVGIDAWFTRGGTQVQSNPRRHDLSDGFALVGFRSLPNVIRDLENNTFGIHVKKDGEWVTPFSITGEGQALINGNAYMAPEDLVAAVLAGIGEGGIEDTIQSLIKTNILNSTYPVGSIYITLNGADPAQSIGGKWRRIRDTFLVAAGDEFAIGETGGKAEYDLRANIGTVARDEESEPDGLAMWGAGMTDYQKRYAPDAKISAEEVDTSQTYEEEARSVVVTEADSESSTTTILPPYTPVYVWERYE